MRTLRALGLVALALALCPPLAGRAADFPLKDGDTWVMVGDSITAQHLHSNYFEAFCYARYPNLTFRFRNSGVGGDQIPSAMKRFAWDVAPWKPTVVSVELGMNDKGGTPVEKYLANMAELTGMIRKAGARPVYLSPSPVNNGDTMAKLGGNQRLHEYSAALKKFADDEKAPYADQFHVLIDVWGKNKPKEVLATKLAAVEALAKDASLAGTEHLKAFLEANKKGGETLVSMQGDAVHPGPTGQLMMAAALLKALGADPVASSASLSADGGQVQAQGCKVSNAVAKDGTLTFERLDGCLPFPIPDEARPGLALFPLPLELSDYRLTVTGLKSGDYTLKVNGVELGKVSGEALGKGINLTAFARGPIADQGKAVLAAVGVKEGLVGQWRGLSKAATAETAPPDARQRLAALAKQVEDADGKIREAARPKPLKFEIAPAK